MTTSPGGPDDAAGDRLTASSSWPYPHLDRATAALRAELRDQTVTLNAGRSTVTVVDQDSLTVDGPSEELDARGRTWFVYTATAKTRVLRNATPGAESPESVTTEP
jgi:hypothetical protein